MYFDFPVKVLKYYNINNLFIIFDYFNTLFFSQIHYYKK